MEICIQNDKCWILKMLSFNQGAFSLSQSPFIYPLSVSDRNDWHRLETSSEKEILWKQENPPTQCEPRHDKTNKMSVRPAKTQISLGIRPVWSASSLCAQRVAKNPSFLHADSEDSDQLGRIPRLIWVFAVRTCHSVGLVVRRLICKDMNVFYWVCSWAVINATLLNALETT